MLAGRPILKPLAYAGSQCGGLRMRVLRSSSRLACVCLYPVTRRDLKRSMLFGRANSKPLVAYAGIHSCRVRFRVLSSAQQDAAVL